MSFDLFMNDTCPKCRKPLKPAAIEQHDARRDLAVHKFDCANCGAVKTKIVFRKQGGTLPDGLAA
jgi:ssDNA-binding Zn-finger/Zn-ribbon topoisomerase 1